MSEYTPAQVAHWLPVYAKDLEDTVERGYELEPSDVTALMRQAATLIEQQAEQIAALRKAIKDAPHERGCSWYWTASGLSSNCWKSKALDS